MSEVKQTALDAATVTKEQLEAIKYHELSDAFKQLGVPEVWKPGTSREDLIKNCLEKLDAAKILKDTGLKSEDDEQATVDKILAAQQAEANKKMDEQAQQLMDAQADKKAQYKAQVEKMKLSKEVIEKNLASISGALKNASEGQRSILLLKQSVLQEMV